MEFPKTFLKNWKNAYGFHKVDKFIWNEKKIGYVIIY